MACLQCHARGCISSYHKEYINTSGPYCFGSNLEFNVFMSIFLYTPRSLSKINFLQSVMFEAPLWKTNRDNKEGPEIASHLWAEIRVMETANTRCCVALT